MTLVEYIHHAKTVKIGKDELKIFITKKIRNLPVYDKLERNEGKNKYVYLQESFPGKKQTNKLAILPTEA
jgi:hypothetical protein